MKKTKEKVLITGIVAILCFLGGYFVTTYFLDKDNETQKEAIVYLEKESIDVTIAKFNTEILDNGLEYPVSDDYLTEENETYFYGVVDEIGFYAVAEKYTGNKKEDITKDTAVFYPISGEYDELGEQYVKHLMKANNPNLTEDEILALMKKAEELSKKHEAADENNGIFISYDELDGNKYYIITRNYR